MVPVAEPSAGTAGGTAGAPRRTGKQVSMKIVIEFYRIRQQDGAHAVVGRETLDVLDLDGAIGAARALAQTLDMPQRPDALCITDATGRTLYSCPLDAATLAATLPEESSPP